MLAITRAISPSLGRCELTHLPRAPIDIARAITQHAAYEDALRAIGLQVVRARPEPDMPDGVFVEDTAIVLDEGAIITRPGAPSRRGETASIADALGACGKPAFMQEGTLDGGDVLRLGQTLFVGRSSRTSDAGIGELARLVASWGYRVQALEVRGCLHLKSAVTQVAADAILLNPECISPDSFGGWRTLTIDPAEPHAANALLVNDRVIFPEHFPRTRARLEHAGVQICTVPCDELAKAEGAVTCCSLLVPYAG